MAINRGGRKRLVVARRTINRRDFLKLSGASLAGASLLGVAGCGGGGGGGGEGGGEIVFNTGPDQGGTLQGLVDRYPEGNVKYELAPTDTGQFFDQLRNRFQAGESSPQVIGGDVIWPVQFAANGYLAPLGEYFPQDQRAAFTEGPIASNTYEDEIYGIPWYIDVGLLYYRRDLLEQAGFSEPPQSWDELKEMAQQIQQDAGIENGFVFQGSRYEGGVCNGLEYIRTHGGDVTDPNDPNRVIADSPETVAGLQTWRSLVEDGVSPQAVTTYTELESQAAFLDGNSVFIRNWPYLYALLGTEESSIQPDQVGVVPLPVAEGGELAGTLGGWNMFVNANAEDPEAAYNFAEYMCSTDTQVAYAEGSGFVPTRTDLLTDPRVQEAIPYLAESARAFETAKPRPVSPVYSDMSLVMQEQFNAMLAGEIPPDEAAGIIQEELQGIVEQAQG